MSDWNHYLATINKHISSVFLDLKAKIDPDYLKYPKLGWIFIRLKIEREDGLSHDDEFDDLYTYETSIIDLLTSHSILYVGCITTNGMRQFYFYLSENESFDYFVNKVVKWDKTYQFQFGTKDDPNWDQFENVLLPAKHGIEQIYKR